MVKKKERIKFKKHVSIYLKFKSISLFCQNSNELLVNESYRKFISHLCTFYSYYFSIIYKTHKKYFNHIKVSQSTTR